MEKLRLWRGDLNELSAVLERTSRFSAVPGA